MLSWFVNSFIHQKVNDSARTFEANNDTYFSFSVIQTEQPNLADLPNFSAKLKKKWLPNGHPS